MKRLIVTISLCLFACLFVNGQSPKLEWGEASKRSIIDEHKMIGSDGENHWVLDYRRKSLTEDAYVEFALKKFDKNLNLVQSEELPTQIEGKNFTINNAILSGNTIWLFSIADDLKGGQRILWVEGINASTLKRTQKPKKLHSRDLNLKSRTRPILGISHSPNRQLIILRSFVLTYSENVGKGPAISEDEITILDDQMNFLWSKSLDFQMVYDIDINNDGLVIGSITKKIGDNSVEGILVLTDEGTGEYFKEIGAVKGSFGQNFRVKFLNKNQAFAYLLTDESSLHVVKIDLETEAVVWDNQFKLSYKLEDQYAIMRSNFEKELGLPLVYMFYKEPLITNDGAVYLMGESYTSLNTPGREPRSFYGDILIMRIDPDGKLEWEKTYEKAQQMMGGFVSTKDANTSFTPLLSSGQDLILLFNDSDKNYKSPTNYELVRVYDGSKKSVVSMLRIPPSGNETRSILYDQKNTPYAWTPESVFALDNDQYIVYGLGSKAFSLARISW